MSLKLCIRNAAIATAALFAVSASAAEPWHLVTYWPRIPLDHGCVGLVYQDAALPGYFTRTKLVLKDGSVLVSPRHPDPATAPGWPTIRAAIDTEKAAHWHGCWGSVRLFGVDR